MFERFLNERDAPPLVDIGQLEVRDYIVSLQVGKISEVPDQHVDVLDEKQSRHCVSFPT